MKKLILVALYVMSNSLIAQTDPGPPSAGPGPVGAPIEKGPPSAGPGPVGIPTGTNKIDITGNIGIGTTSPTAKLQVNHVTNDGEKSKTGILITRRTETTSDIKSYDKGIYSSLGYSISSGITDTGYKIGVDASSYSRSINFRGTLNKSVGIWARAGIHEATSGAKLKSAIAVSAEVLDNVTGTTIDNVYGVKIATNNYKESTVINRYDLYAGTTSAKNYFAGYVGIGTTSPDAKLTVKGNIHTQEVRVDLLGVLAPDYVFLENYNLKTLEEVSAHIEEKGHLPNVPSAKEMEKNGVKLKVMTLKLLEKIEELTLYTISQEKKIKGLEKDKERLDNLEKLVAQLLKNK
ncbi:tail fiber protein [Tenacibaculum dicentrarchi]|nr:tail fiber protein [Tenacibaculum dicentrarchi]